MKESLQEMIEVARYCIEYDKTKRWGYPGCYGYPGALLLLCIADAIGAEIMGGGSDTKQHFKILNHKDYYNLRLGEIETEFMRHDYRNMLAHNSQIGYAVAMRPGRQDGPIIEKISGTTFLNLKPFLLLSESVLDKFLNKI